MEDSMSMKERVARALVTDRTMSLPNAYKELSKEDILDAPTAISTMRVPTRAMLDSARLGLNDPAIKSFEAAATRAWEIMISAALRENLFTEPLSKFHPM